MAIILSHLPDIEERLAVQVARFVRELRKEDLDKNPGIAETLDWAAALTGLGVKALDDNLETVQSSLICLLKTERDLKLVTPEVTGRLAGQAA